MPIDITKIDQPQKLRFSKDYLVNFLASIIPSGIVITLLKMVGITGAIIPVVIIFGFAYLAGRIRGKYNKKTNKITSWKTVLFWIIINLLFFGLMILALAIAA